MEEKLAHKIQSVISACCPCFRHENCSTGVAWHQSKCSAGDSCTCVWHCTDKCEAGTWPQLSFVADIQAKQAAEQERELSKAKSTIAKAEKE